MKISVITPSIRPEYLDMTQECLERQTFKDFEWNVVLGLRNGEWTLPSDWNRLIRQSSGDIIVMLQDCIKIPDDALERIAKLDHDMKAYTFPVGKAKYYDARAKWDWRKHVNGKVRPDQWEIDFASAPRSLFYDVGGFDEEFNKGWSWENVEIAQRAEMAGYNFFCDNKLAVTAMDHDAVMAHPFRTTREANNLRAYNSRMDAINGDWKKKYL